MKKILISFTVWSLMAVFCIHGEDTEKLERGKHYIKTPVLSEGLCVNNLFQSNMVIQRDKPIAVWGWAQPDEKVTVTMSGKSQTVTADKDRLWKVTLPAFPANSNPQTLTVKGRNKTLTFENILVGDVWVVGGQSNMQHPLSRVENGPMEIVSANFPEIRLLTVPAMIDNKKKKNFPIIYRWENGHNREGFWDVCSPESVPEFSAIGYIFARRLHMASKIPIGVIDASRWGTTVEAWTPLTVLKAMKSKSVDSMIKEWDEKVKLWDPQKDLEARIKRYNQRMDAKEKQGLKVNRKPPSDLGLGPLHNQNYPGNCYNSLIAPLEGFAVRGAIFHQGFNNSRADADQFYYPVMKKMISAWRSAFNDPEMAFGIISLCTDSQPQTLKNYNECIINYGIYVREAQYKTFKDLYNAGDKNIGFASSYDLRRAWYHPQCKIPAGERIARWALATQYGHKSVHWKPAEVTNIEKQKGKILLHFELEVGALESGSAITGFAIAGSDKKFQPAKAEYLITGKDGRGRPTYNRKIVVLSHPLVPNPVHYRYAWGRNPMGNLQRLHTNQKDIPVGTQRSDNWTTEELYEAYMGGKPKASKLDRRELNELKNALKAADKERAIFEAKALIEAEKNEK